MVVNLSRPNTVAKLSRPSEAMKMRITPTPDQMEKIGKWLETPLVWDEAAAAKMEANVYRIMGNVAQPA